jgi:hypothetical protein
MSSDKMPPMYSYGKRNLSWAVGTKIQSPDCMERLRERESNSNYPNTSFDPSGAGKFLCETSHELSAHTLRMLHLMVPVTLSINVLFAFPI